jgi:hypothetical protein
MRTFQMTSLLSGARRHVRTILLAASSLSLFACGTEDAPGPLQPTGPVGRVRFVNVITDPARVPVNAILESVPFGVNLGYGATTPASLPAPSTASYAQILAGARSLVLKRTADTMVVLATIPVTMSANEDRTVYATGGTGGAAVANFQTVDDNALPATGSAKFRAVNLSAGPVDVFVTANNADLTTATPTFANVAAASASGYVTMTAGSYQIRTVPAGTAAAARAGAVNLTIASTAYPSLGIRTILVAPAAAGGAPLRGFIYTDR